MRLLLVFEQCKIDRGAGRFLLAERQLLLGCREIRSRRVQQLLVAIAFFFERRQALLSLRQLRFGGRRAHHQLRAALFVGSDARLAAIPFDRDLVETVAILPRLGLNRVSALRALGVLGFGLLHALRLLANFLAQFMDLGIEGHTFLIHLSEPAGEHNPQFGSHLVAQPGIALGLAGLAFERVHLPRDFFENVVHAIQIRLGVFEPRLGEALLRLEFRNAGGFFDNVAAVGRTAAQDLADASLLDERIRLRPQPRSHEQFLDVAQAAQLPIQQVFAVTAAEKTARHRNHAGVVLLLIEFAPADFQNYLRDEHCHCAAVC